MRTRTKGVSVQVGSDAIDIPLVKTWQVGGNEVRVQYDSGATITLIGAKTLAKFPASVYRLGRNRIARRLHEGQDQSSCRPEEGGVHLLPPGPEGEQSLPAVITELPFHRVHAGAAAENHQTH